MTERLHGHVDDGGQMARDGQALKQSDAFNVLENALKLIAEGNAVDPVGDARAALRQVRRIQR